MKINMLPAAYGDCMLIELKKNNYDRFTILIDGGTVGSYKKDIKESLENYLKDDCKIDLVILTHSDNDHISGMNCILQNKNIVAKINRVIYNSPYAIGKKFNLWDENELTKTTSPKVIKRTKVSKGFHKKNLLEVNNNEIDVNTSAKKANELQRLLFDLDKLEMNLVVNNGESDIESDGIKIQFLSPTEVELKDFFYAYKSENQNNKNSKNILRGNTASYKTDYDIPFEELLNNTEKKKLSKYNMSSLAFIITEECTGESILIMGDSSYDLVMKKLLELKDNNGILYCEKNKLKLNYLKLSHHGSICDLDKEFLKIIDCRNFLISSDGSIYGHPDKKLIARVCSVIDNSIFYFNYESRKKMVTREGGIIQEICRYKREF